MTYKTQCRMCKADIILTIEDELLKLYPFGNLIPMVGCNHCVDLYRGIKDTAFLIRRVCLNLNCHAHPSDELIKSSRTALEKLSKRFVALVGERVGVRNLPWEEELVDQMVGKPSKYEQVLHMVWEAARFEAKNQPALL